MQAAHPCFRNPLRINKALSSPALGFVRALADAPVGEAMAIGLRLNYWLATGMAGCGLGLRRRQPGCAIGGRLAARRGAAMARPLLAVPRVPPAQDSAHDARRRWMRSCWPPGLGGWQRTADQVDESLRLVRPFNSAAGARLLHVGAGWAGVCRHRESTGCRVAGLSVIRLSSMHLNVDQAVQAGDDDAAEPGGPEPPGPRWDHAYVRFVAHD